MVEAIRRAEWVVFDNSAHMAMVGAMLETCG